MAIVKKSPCLCPEMPLSSWRPAPSQRLMPSVTVQLGPQHPSLSLHPGGIGEGVSCAGLRTEPQTPRSPALLPGVPVVRGLRRVLVRRVCLHRGLLLCAGPGQRDQHRCVLVPAHRRLLRVSFLRLPKRSGRREACGSRAGAFLPPCPEIGISVTSCCPTKLPRAGWWSKTATILFDLLLGHSLISALRGPTLQQGKPGFLLAAETPARRKGCCQPPEALQEVGPPPSLSLLLVKASHRPRYRDRKRDVPSAFFFFSLFF